MTKKLQSERILAALHFISAGPSDINQQEVDTADLIGFAIDTLYDDSPFSFDTDGNITSARGGKSAQAIFTGIAGATGFRIADTSNNKEILVSLEDDQLIIYENRMVADGGTGVIKETADWKERFNIDLHGGSGDGDIGDSPGQDIRNHTNFPSFQSLKYLRANSDADALEFASFDSAKPDSCGIQNTISVLNCIGYGTWRNGSKDDDTDHVSEEWDNADMVFNVATDAYDYIEIQTAGIYSIVMTASILQSQAGASTGYRGVGYNFLSDSNVNKSVRHPSFDYLAATHQVFTGSWVTSFDANTKLYPKLNQTNNGGETLNMYFRMAVTKISEE